MSRYRLSPNTRFYSKLRELAPDQEQRQIAAALGASPATVSTWKRGTPPRIEAVITAARVYGVDEIELIKLVYDL
jgi:transcriptional regulator with XRE-family HTH domain